MQRQLPIVSAALGVCWCVAGFFATVIAIAMSSVFLRYLFGG